MNYEWLAILVIIIVAIILLAEFLWLYILSEKREAHIRNYDQAYTNIMEKIDAILHSPTLESQDAEIASLIEYTKDDFIKLDMICTKIYDLIVEENLTEYEAKAIVKINDSINPVMVYKTIMKGKDAYYKAYSCRKIADFFGEDSIENIRQFVSSKNKDLSYNAVMALSALGDEQSVLYYIFKSEENYTLSHRVIIELIENYSGDISALARKIFEISGDYLKAIVIKAISQYRLEEFEKLFIEGLNSKNINIKISCVKALSEIAKPEYEQDLLIAIHDNNWVVRLSAIKGLEQNVTTKSLVAVCDATSDKEWWVRFNAARSLIKMDKDFKYVEKVLNGYDKYAADTVKYALYRATSLNEEEQT